MSISRQIAKGATWMVALRLSVKLISILSTVILARLLAPADFGLIALASSIYALVELFKGFGFDMALIQNQQSDKAHYDTAWTLNIIFSSVASVLIVLCSGQFSQYYHDPRLSTVLIVIALLVFVDGFSNIGTVEFRKSLNFQKEFRYQLFTKLISFFVTIPLAYLLRNYWALLFGMLSNAIASVFLSYKLQAYRPKLSLRAKGDLFKFCSWLYINNILQVLNKNAQNFILARVSGSAGLGIYSLADEVAMITTTEVIAPINRAAYPGYAKLANEKSSLKSVYLNTLSFISLIALPCSIGVSVVAPLFVPLMLGDQWVDAIPIIQLLALSSALESLNTNSTYIFIVLVRQNLITKLLAIRFVVLFPFLLVLSNAYGNQGAAAAVVLTSIILCPIQFGIIRNVLSVKIKEIVIILYRPVVASLLMGVVVDYVMLHQEDRGYQEIALYLFSDILVGVVCYISMVLAVWKVTGAGMGAERMIVDLLLSVFKNRHKLYSR